MTGKNSPIRETDTDALALAEKLIAQNQYAALGVKEPKTGIPLVSRIGYSWSKETGLFFCASDLSMHCQCLLADKVCSLLIGEPGKGDGLAHPRVTVVGHTERLENHAPDSTILRNTFLGTHPKAELYIDFADFGFYPLVVERAFLNGGFGKAYHLDQNDLAFLRD